MQLKTILLRAACSAPAAAFLSGAAAFAAEAEQGEGGLPQLNPATYPSQLFWAAVFFVILYILMSKVALPRVAEVIEHRNQRIGEDLDKAAQAQQEAEAALAQYEQALSEARTQAQAIVRTVNEEAARSAAEAQQALADELAAQTRDAESRIAAAREAALGQVRAIAADVARAAASRLAGREIDAARVEAAVQAAAQERR